MSEIFQWVKNITYYLIFVSIIFNLMPAGKYERYIRLFSGAVFLLLVAGPLTGGLKLEGKLAYAYEKLLFWQDTSGFEDQLYELEQERTRQVIKQYEKAVAQDIKAMAEGEGLFCAEVNVQIKAEDGQVAGIDLVLKRRGATEEEGAEVLAGGTEIRIQVEIEDNREGSRLTGTNQMTAGEKEVLDGFQRKVAGIYGLEETDIRITWKDD